MGLLELFILAVGLSMDAFAVSICKGLALPKINLKSAGIVGLWFGAFQALMPLIGYLLGVNFREYIVSVDHWIAFILLALIGGNMIKEALSDDNEEESEIRNLKRGGEGTIDGYSLELSSISPTGQIALSRQNNELKEIFGPDEHKKTLVIGLGNWNITSDALGPRSVSKTLVTRHIFKNYNKDYDDDFTEVAALSPGVMGVTGLETSETVKAIVDTIKPDRVVAIDALASRKMERVNSTIQISTAGISPGGGVGNKRKALNKEYLGVDVIAIGVPTVVDAATLTNDVLNMAIHTLMEQSGESSAFYEMLNKLQEEEKYQLIRDSLDPYDQNLIVTPKDIDETIENLSIIISEGLNRSLHPGRTS